MTNCAPTTEGVTTPPITPTRAVALLRRLIALDGAFFPCLEECAHLSCEVESRVLAILERVE